MLVVIRSLLVVLFLGFTSSLANAGFTQNLYFFVGEDPSVDPVLSARIIFPQELGCVSGEAFFVPPFDCATDTPFPGDTNVPGEISISSTLGPGIFNVGLWSIDDSGLLTSRFSFTAGGFEIGVPLGFPYPGEEDPIGTIGTARTRNIATGEEAEYGVLAIPVPLPSSLVLVCLGLVVFGMSARKGV